MTAIEIILILIGVIFMIGSFFVTEKLSQKEITQISELSSDEMRRILEKNMEYARQKMEELADEVVEDTREVTKRALEKETNLKIQTISEYSDGVLEAIKRNHDEVMFLYSMLNDKHSDLTEIAGKLEKLKQELVNLEREVTGTVTDSAELVRQLSEQMSNPVPVPIYVQEEEVFQDSQEPEEEEEITGNGCINQNQNILELYQQGIGITDIARQLKLGVGEVKLVIDLYKGEEV